MMTLYAGQTKDSVTPLEKEDGLSLFDESTRREANTALKTGIVPYGLKANLESMYVDGSHQAGYFLGTMIIQGIIEYPVEATWSVPRGDAGPGMAGEEYERMVRNMQSRIFASSDDTEQSRTSIVASVDYLHGPRE